MKKCRNVLRTIRRKEISWKLGLIVSRKNKRMRFKISMKKNKIQFELNTSYALLMILNKVNFFLPLFSVKTLLTAILSLLMMSLSRFHQKKKLYIVLTFKKKIISVLTKLSFKLMLRGTLEKILIFQNMLSECWKIISAKF